MSRIVYTSREQKWPRSARRGLRLKLFIIFGLLTLLLGGAIIVVRIPKFQLAEIEFQGLSVLSPEELKAAVFRITDEGIYTGILPGRSMFILVPPRLEEHLRKEYPRIEDIKINHRFPNRLLITVKERVPWAIFCIEEKSCAYVDKRGFAMEWAPSTEGSLIRKVNMLSGIVEVGGQAIDTGFMEYLLSLGERTEKVLGSKIVKYEIERAEAKEIKLYTDEGFYLIFLRDDDFENTFWVLKKILNEEIKEKRPRLEYIDLRFGNKVFYKFRKD